MFLKNLPKLITFSVLTLILSGCSLDNLNSSGIIQNLGSQIPVFWHLISGASFLMGIFFIIKSILKLKIFGEMRSMMAQHGSLTPILSVFFVGIGLCSLPSVIYMFMNSFFGNFDMNSLPYQNASPTINLYGLIIALVQLMGLLSFVRGWTQLAKIGDQSGRHSMGKAMTHIISGIMALNIIGTKQIFFSIFGLS